MKPVVFALLFAACSYAHGVHKAESIPFRMNMSPNNEVPALPNLDASGFGTVWLHVVRDEGGAVVSGTVDFVVRHRFPGATTFTGLHIHRGNAGTNGPVLIDTRITGANPVVSESGSGEIARSAVVLEGSANVAVLNEILANPEGFYLNLHTTVNPGGAVRSQLKRTEYRVFGAVMSPANEVPAVQNSNASGIGFVTLLAGVDANGALESAEVTFEVSYAGFADGTQFTGMHIHRGRGGANGPVTIDTGLSRAQNILAGANGAGNLRYVVDLNMANAASIATVYAILNDPDEGYLNLHTVANAGGEIRAQLRPTEAVKFSSLEMWPSNEVPPVTGLNATANAAFQVSMLRRADGAALAGLMVFDVNHVFPGETTFTGLHIHVGAAGTNGGVVLDSGIRGTAAVLSATGVGNIYRVAMATTEAQLMALNGLLANPRGYYINLHTTVNPGGAVRAQLAELTPGMPRIDNVIQSVSDVTRSTLAQGGLMTLYGANFAQVPGSLDGWAGARAPMALNGVSVTADGKDAPVLQVRENTVIAQVPFEAATGTVDIVLKGPGGTSNAFRAPLARVAPAIFFDQVNSDGNRAVIFDLATGAQITQDSRATNGMTLGIFGTGFGQSAPAQTTGEVASLRVLARFPEVRVSVGSLSAANVVTVLIPGYVGLTQTIFTVPAASGAQTVEVEYQGARSNRTVLYMR
jgi:uncharacterized protein (TIGR03437 family)